MEIEAPDRGAIAGAARQLYRRGPFVLRTLQQWRPYICPFEALLPLVPRGASVLDIGCGSGLFLALLHHFDYDVQGFGFDTSPLAIECARSMAHTDLRFELIASDEKWPAGQYDVVSLIDVMHHIPRDAQGSAFREAAGRVRPGGILLYKDISNAEWYSAAGNRIHDFLIARQWIHYLPIESTEQWARECSMTVDHSDRIRTLWYEHDVRAFRRLSA